jgi:hypothetical protein
LDETRAEEQAKRFAAVFCEILDKLDIAVALPIPVPDIIDVRLGAPHFLQAPVYLPAGM